MNKLRKWYVKWFFCDCLFSPPIRRPCYRDGLGLNHHSFLPNPRPAQPQPGVVMDVTQVYEVNLNNAYILVLYLHKI